MGAVTTSDDTGACNQTDFAIIMGKRLHLEKHLFNAMNTDIK